MKRDVRFPFPSTIVVRGVNWVGDTVMSIPAAREVRRIFPLAKISFWVKSGLAPLIYAAGVADELIPIPEEVGGAFRRTMAMRQALRAERFPMAIFFQNAFEAAFTAWLARIPLRAGYPTDVRGPLLTLRIPLTWEIQEKHQVYYYLGITDFLDRFFHGRSSRGDATPDCSVVLAPHQIAHARDLLIGQGVDPLRPIFCLCPGSVNSEAKRWPADHFAELADELIKRFDAQVVFLGSHQETELIGDIQRMTRQTGAFSLAGALDMVSAMAVMQVSRLVISNDTGSAHLAVAASARVLTIFGPTIPGATAPFGPGAQIIQGSSACAPCAKFRCPLPEHPCMRSVTTAAVLEKVQEIVSRFSS
jgi:heptosyltransferase-2